MPLVLPAYVDDCAVPVEGGSPAQVVARLAAVAVRVRPMARQHGFMVNVEEGKTEAIAFFGPVQARDLMASLEASLDGGPV